MNIKAALKSRLSSLMVGAKGAMLNCRKSIPAADLFSRPAVIELENMGDDDEKAFLMGLIVSRLYEYRKATFGDEPEMSLRHVLVIEEAHRLLANVPDTSADMEAGNPRGKAVSSFVDMLSEIRAFGQSVIVVDQLPSRVSPNIVKGTGTKIVHRLLAKDDRESVGWTMGMNDAQMADLSLLHTGECVVSQDGDTKSYLCRVTRCEEHERVWSVDVSTATKKYRCEHELLFCRLSDDVDLEDWHFKDSLYKIMLAIGLGEQEGILDMLSPTRSQGEWDRKEWLAAYWNQICSELWGFHGGRYGDFLALKNSGLVMFKDGSDAVTQYRDAFKRFMSGSRHNPVSTSDDCLGVAFEPYFLGQEVVRKVNSLFAPTGRMDEDKYMLLATAIRKVLPLLEPEGVSFSADLQKRLATEVLARISNDLVEPVLSRLKEWGD